MAVQAPPPGAGAPMQQEAPSAQKALIVAILAIFCNGFLLLIPSILAIVWGNAAKKEIAASGGTLGGDGKATAAVVIGWIMVALAVVGAVFYVFAVLLASSNS